MKKYLQIAKIAVINQSIYPTSFFSMIMAGGASLLIAFFVWGTIFSVKETVGDFTFPTIITYFAIIFSIRIIVGSAAIARSMSRDMRQGTLAFLLIKPVNYNFYQFAKTITEKLLQIIAPILAFGILVYLFKDTFLPPQNLSFAIVALVQSIVVAHIIYSIIGTSAFWTIQSWGIIAVAGRFMDALNGSIFPLDLLPEKIFTVITYLPFQYMGYLPAAIYIGRVTGVDVIRHLIIQFLWIVILALTYRWLWTKGIKKFDSVGQ